MPPTTRRKVLATSAGTLAAGGLLASVSASEDTDTSDDEDGKDDTCTLEITAVDPDDGTPLEDGMAAILFQGGEITFDESSSDSPATFEVSTGKHDVRVWHENILRGNKGAEMYTVTVDDDKSVKLEAAMPLEVVTASFTVLESGTCEPIECASIEGHVTVANGKNHFEAETDVDGTAEVTTNRHHWEELEVRADGYESERRTDLEVNDGDHIEVELDPA